MTPLLLVLDLMRQSKMVVVSTPSSICLGFVFQAISLSMMSHLYSWVYVTMVGFFRIPTTIYCSPREDLSEMMQCAFNKHS